jgi:hypothetical protein
MRDLFGFKTGTHIKNKAFDSYAVCQFEIIYACSGNQNKKMDTQCNAMQAKYFLFLIS